MTARLKVFALMGLVVATAAIWNEALLYSQNTLYYNPRWYPARATLYGLRGGGIEALMGRQPLSGGRLRGEQHTALSGQRLFTRHSYAPQALEFEFRLRSNSWVALTFNHVGERYQAVRLSLSELKPSLHYVANRHERYLEAKPLALPTLAPGRHHLRLTSSAEGLTLWLNGSSVARLPLSFIPGKVGVEVSERSEIWTPVVTQAGQTQPLPFTRDQAWVRFFLVNLAALVVLVGVFALAVRRWRWQRTLRFLIVLFGSGCLWHAFDYFFYSREPMNWSHRDLVTVSREAQRLSFDFEPWRYRFFQRWYALAGGEVPERQKLVEEMIQPIWSKGPRLCRRDQCAEIPQDKLMAYPAPAAGSLRLMVVGGSLSAGWGVSDITQVYSEQLHHLMQSRYPGRLVETLNVSHPSTLRGEAEVQNLVTTIERFAAHYVFFEFYLFRVSPRLVERLLQGLQHHQLGHKIFLKLPITGLNLERLGRLEGKRVLESSMTQEHHMLLQRWAKQYGLRLMEPPLTFIDKDLRLRGNFFWDIIHLSDVGHERFAWLIAQQLTPLIEGAAPER